jgi:uncharacterized protein (TIGR03790 family)
MLKGRLIIFALCLVAGVCVLLPASDCQALDPREIIVITNRNVPDSTSLAFYYMTRRHIPAENLLTLSLTDKEHCSREEYDREVAAPVRRFLAEKDPAGRKFRCIVTMFGVPLSINDSGLSQADRVKIAELRGRIRNLRTELTNGQGGKKEKEKAYKEKFASLEQQIRAITKSDNSAAFDSELALVLESSYLLTGWVPNPYFLGYRGKKINHMPAKAFMVARLDGPTKQTVSRIIDDSLAAEAKGLQGTAYFDARWPYPGEKRVTGYELYDRSLHNTAKHLKKNATMPVVLDEKERLLQPGEAPNAALYCGWYSLAKYVDAFTWVRGAVGYHIASAECDTLRQPGSQVWCKAMLEKGVAATIGPVGEPYVQAFPLPEIFFVLLTDGRLTLAECYALSNPFLSWKIVLVGDPLYRPFRYRLNGTGAGPRQPHANRLPR